MSTEQQEPILGVSTHASKDAPDAPGETASHAEGGSEAAAPPDTHPAADRPTLESASDRVEGVEGEADGEAGDEAEEEADGEANATGEGPALNADGTPAAPKKKRRRRRKRKKPEGAADGAPGPAGESAGPAEGGEHAHDGHGPDGHGHDGHGPDGHHGHHHEGDRRRRPDPREVLPFRIGEEVFGKVERVTEDAVWIDVAGKALGIFDRRELGEGEPPQAGDQFIATVASHGVRGGVLRMSRAVLPLDDARQKVENAMQTGEAVEGFVTGAVKGGIEVDIEGLRAFAPASHVDLRPGGDLSPLVGRLLKFIVVQYEKKGRDVVVSRKKFLHDEAMSARAEAMKLLKPGSVHKGFVRTIVQWGVFVALPDAGNLEGLIHASEASHDRIATLSDLFKVGDQIEVKVLRIDEKGKIWLSRRAMLGDPWDAVAQKYAMGTRHTGKVVRLQPFGAFIELEPGVDGLCYTADLSFKQIEHPKDILKLDQQIEVVVGNTDSSTRKISLHPAPPADEADEPRPKVGPHRVVKVAVVQAVEGGLIVRVIGLTGRAARGFIPAGHTGTERGSDLRKSFPVGTKLEAKVIEVDARRGESKLSIRAMKEDSEKQAYSEYRDTVKREAKFGTFADLLLKK